MATDLLSSSTTPSTATVAAGLFVAGLGVVYAYTQLGQVFGAPKDTDTRAPMRAHTTRPSADGEPDATGRGGVKSAASTSDSGRTTRKGRKRKKGKGKGVDVDVDVDVDVGEDEEEGQDKGKGEDEDEDAAAVVPGDFEGAGADAKVDAAADVGSQEASPAGTSPKPGNGEKTKRRKNKKKQGKGKHGDGNEDEGSEAGKEVRVGRTAAHGPRSGDSTDASVSLSPSVSASALASSRAMGKGNLRASTRLAPPSQPHAQARVHAPSQPREIRSSLSLDTDGSWTHVDHRRLKTSKSTDGLAERLADAVDMTSSDMASTASDSPVVERMDSIVTDMRGTRADLAQRTLAEKLVPKPRKSGVDDMLEQPDFPTLARVMRVQPPADETPVPGFSWDDYGDVVEESVLVHDADEEDEGEWGIVKSRSRTRPPQMTTVASTSTSTSPPAAPGTMTKKQRQNARKRELAKSAKAGTEVARLEGLATHKRELERLRIIEQSQHGGGKRPSGGMHATVDDRGKLVWE